jgi:hypothetical protein
MSSRCLRATLGGDNQIFLFLELALQIPNVDAKHVAFGYLGITYSLLTNLNDEGRHLGDWRFGDQLH